MSNDGTDDQIDAMPYRELQKECRKVGLSATGKREALRKRLRGWSKPTEESSASAKRYKKNEDDLICPISLNLPFEPVIAEDGRVYEKQAIEEYYKNKTEARVKSPYTGQMMAKRLIPTPQIKNHIETLIETGSIAGELADEWKKKQQNKKAMEELVEKAKNGDVDAMERVAISYDQGIKGFKQDQKVAFQWYQKAHAVGSVVGMATEGEMLIIGLGVEKDVQTGMMYLGMAEGRGCGLAAYALGLYFADGLHGCPVDKRKARQLLEKSLNHKSPFKYDMGTSNKLAAQEILDQLTEDS